MSGKYDLTSEDARLQFGRQLTTPSTGAISSSRSFGNRGVATAPICGQIRYFATSSEGTQLEIPKELFRVLWDFLNGEKQAGSATIHFRNGGIAGLEALIKKSYK